MILGIIQSRLQSERLPDKALMSIAGKPILKHVIDRVAEVESLDAVVVATYYGGNGAIAGHCEEWGTRCYQYDGPADDVLARFDSCAKSIHCTNAAGEPESVEYVLRVCGDNPLFDPQSADELIAAAYIHKADYAGYKLPGGAPAITKPLGYFGEVVTMEALERANNELPKDAPEREHVTACMYGADQARFSRPFNCHFRPLPKWYAKERLKYAAIDTMKDYERVREVLEKE